MKIKYTLLLLVFITLTGSCSTTPSIVLKFQERRYRPCTVEEIKKFRPKSDRITFCWRYCAKYKVWRKHEAKNCKIWKTDILDSNEDFSKIRDAGFVLINEKRIY